jgi:hypothetical protein
MIGNDSTGTSKSFQVLSLDNSNSWIKVNDGLLPIAERGIGFYIIGAAYISGASTLTLNSTQTYTLTDFMDPRLLIGDNSAVSCYSISWTCSSNLSIQLSKGNSKNVTANATGLGWLRAQITINGITQDVLKDILVSNSPDPTMSVSINTYSVVGGNDVYATAVTSPTATSYLWTFNGQILVTNSPDVVLIYNSALPLQTNTLAVTASDPSIPITGSASQSISGKFTLNEFGLSVITYPNPVSDILNVDITTSQTQNAEVARLLLNNRTYNIRLYTMQGSLVRQTTGTAGTMSIDVSNLPNGIYLLNISDGIKEPIVRQIIVSH